MDIQNFMLFFEVLEDTRRRQRWAYPLSEILFSAVCATLSGCENWEEVSVFSRERLSYLRRYYPFENGRRATTRIGVFSPFLSLLRFEKALPSGLNRCLRRFLASLR
jgi:DDE_Tnp_1-associated